MTYNLKYIFKITYTHIFIIRIRVVAIKRVA